MAVCRISIASFRMRDDAKQSQAEEKQPLLPERGLLGALVKLTFQNYIRVGDAIS